MTTNPTDLRRAKALRPLLRDLATCLGNPCYLEPCECSNEFAAAIRQSDKAAGMVLVQREVTDKMVIAALDAWYVPPMVPWREQPGDIPFRFMDDMRRTLNAVIVAHGGEDG
jgi:hypothetical protein